MLGERDVGSKGHIKKDEGACRSLLEGRQQGCRLHPVKELCWLVLGMDSLSHFLRLDGHVAFSSAPGEMIFRNGDNWRMILNRNRLVYHSVMPCLYTKGRFMLTEHIWGCHATAVVLWEKGNDGVEVGLVDRRTLKFQFLNTRKQGIVWSQSFSEEIECSFSVLHPPSPKPGGKKKPQNPIMVMKVKRGDTAPSSFFFF